MSIAAGTRLGRYEIRALLGAGGMGEVYLARDTKLDRTVALKILPTELAADQRRMGRFVQEARAASALNHPHIITIYEIEDEAQPPYIATEFIDGETLRARMQRGEIRLNDALEIVTQIASALAAAHAAGIVHRDIKPENVMLRPDGYVKVLDFGLAKLTEHNAAAIDTEAATRAFVVTDPGAVMGTVAYMSPEQARGLETDARTDLWSLGCVLYEMIAGRLPFAGATPTDTILAIVDREPTPLRALVPEVPEALEWIVAKALTKEKEERYQTARELLTDLRRLKQRLDVNAEIERSTAPHVSGTPQSSAGEHETQVVTQPARTAEASAAATMPSAANVSSTEFIAAKIKTHKRGFAIALCVAALLVVGVVVKLVGAGYLLGAYTGRRAQVSASPIAPLQQMKFSKIPVSNGWAVISPDGRFLVRMATEKSKTGLWLRQVGATAEREIVPPADVYFTDAEFSPDGNSIYYVAGETGKNFQRLYRVSVIGGDPQKLIDDVDSGVSFSPDGKRLAFRRHSAQANEDALVVADAGGGSEQVIAKWHPPVSFLWPAWSPDGQVFACFMRGKDEQGEYFWLEAAALADGSTKPITSERWLYITTYRWLPGGEGLVVTGKPRTAPVEDRGQVWYIPFPAGAAQKITNDTNHYFAISLTADGRTALVAQSNLASNVWVVPAGDFARARQVTNSTSEIGETCWTPDGRIIYSYAAAGRFLDLWLMNPDGTGNRQLTFTPDRHDSAPALSPDGRQIVFETFESGRRTLYRMNMDGGGVLELVRDVDQFSYPRVSPDGRWVFYNSRDESGHDAFWKVPFEGGAPVKVRENARCKLSPDGARLGCYYREPVSNAPRQYIVVPAEGGEPLQTLAVPQDASYMDWSPDGRAIDFLAGRDGADNIYRLPLAGGREQKLTDWQAPTALYYFAWSRDGKQLAVVRDSTSTDLVLIQNFR